MEFLRQFFLNPAALWGAALVGVPILIYLINRHRFRRRRWAAMDFLLRAMRRNQRRIQIENLLLLLIRCAVVFLIAVAMAKPVLRQRALSVSSSDEQNWVLVIDDSFSMGYEDGGSSRFDESREAIAQMAASTFKPKDKVALVTMGAEPRVLLPPSPFDNAARKALTQALDDLQLSSSPVDLGASMALVDEVCGTLTSQLGDPEPKRVLIFSDLQRKDWLGDAGPRDATVPTTIDKMRREYGRFALARVASRESAVNLAVTDLSVTPPLVARDVWVEFRATIRNYGLEDIAGIDLSIQVDPDPSGEAEPQLGAVIEVPAGGTEVRSMAFKFDTAGYHTVVAEVRSDGLVVDNRRYLVVRVEDSVRVLLVDGEPTADELERETFHLEAALKPEDDDLGPGGGKFTPFEPLYLPFDRLGDVDWDEYAVVVLANVAELSEPQAASLSRYVAGGGSLIVFLGDLARPAVYNDLFRRGEAPLLPVPLGDVRGDERYPVFLQVADEAHPIAAYFAERAEFTHLPLIAFSRYHVLGEGVTDEDLSRLRIPFRFTDLDHRPAVFDSGHGKGRSLWVLSSADREWNEFGKWPDFVVFLYEAMSYLVRFGASSHNLDIGEIFQKRYQGAEFASEVLLHAPAHPGDALGGEQTIRKSMREIGDSGDFEIVHDATDVPGLFRLDLLRPNRTAPDSFEYFAVNVDHTESDLRTMSLGDFQEHFGSLEFEVFDVVENLREASGQKELLRGREYWRHLLYAVLALLACESVLALLFGRRSQ